MNGPIDIVLCTKNRLPILQQTIDYLFERTQIPFRLSVIDDASQDGTERYLSRLHQESKIFNLILRPESRHIGENWNAAPRLAKSELMVFTDDDILCPKLEPDWLERGINILEEYSNIGMLALNNPSANAVHAIKTIHRNDEVTICDRIGAHMAIIRRKLMQSIKIPLVGGYVGGMKVQANSSGLDRAWSSAIRQSGYEVAYQTQVYCQHIGIQSTRNGNNLIKRAVQPLNAQTLEPPIGYRG